MSQSLGQVQRSGEIVSQHIYHKQIQYSIQLIYSLLMHLSKQVRERFQTSEPIEQLVHLELHDLGLSIISPPLVNLLSQARNLQILKLSDNYLENIDPLPLLSLRVLQLDNNRLNQNALPKIGQFIQLRQLVLCNNQIKNFQALQHLFKLQRLQCLELTDNPVIKVQGYRQTMFKEFPRLQWLDQLDAHGNEDPENQSEEEDDSDDIYDD